MPRLKMGFSSSKTPIPKGRINLKEIDDYAAGIGLPVKSTFDDGLIETCDLGGGYIVSKLSENALQKAQPLKSLLRGLISGLAIPPGDL